MNKIELAVAPLRDAAMNRAEEIVRGIIASWVAKLIAANWDREIVAPFPSSTRLGREAYRKAQAEYYQVRSITKGTVVARAMHSPDICTLSDELCERLVNTFREQAAGQYEEYVAKLNKKIGAVADATLRGNHVWSLSFLDVTKEDGSKETWKTRMIMNCSIYGKLFNQWPTRKVAA